MQEASKYLSEANKLLRTADHLTYVTYPLVKDNKLIISIIKSLADAMSKAVDALLYYDKYYKRIMTLPKDFQSRLEIFRGNCAPRYNINVAYLTLIKDLKTIEYESGRAPMEFVRKDQYVIAQNNFKIRTLTYQKVKDYVNLSKGFFEKINSIMKNVNQIE